MRCFLLCLLILPVLLAAQCPLFSSGDGGQTADGGTDGGDGQGAGGGNGGTDGGTGTTSAIVADHAAADAFDSIPITSLAGTIANYRIWDRARDKNSKAADTHSSTLFDTVAVYLAFTQDLCKMERLGIRVDDKGFTHIDDQAKQMWVATEWKSLDGFRDFLVKRLTGHPIR